LKQAAPKLLQATDTTHNNAVPSEVFDRDVGTTTKEGRGKEEGRRKDGEKRWKRKERRRRWRCSREMQE
jgi:hypothetical protein